MTVFQRLAVRKRLQRIQDPIANFFAGATCATLVGGILVTAFSWGWIGSVIVAAVFTLVYLGALALLAAIIEIFVEVAKLMAVWLKRKVFMVATFITRIASWVSSLSGRLGLRSFVEKIRADTMEQESRFVTEQEDQDRRLFEAYMRDRASRRRLMAKHGGKSSSRRPGRTPLHRRRWIRSSRRPSAPSWSRGPKSEPQWLLGQGYADRGHRIPIAHLGPPRLAVAAGGDQCADQRPVRVLVVRVLLQNGQQVGVHLVRIAGVAGQSGQRAMGPEVGGARLLPQRRGPVGIRLILERIAHIGLLGRGQDRLRLLQRALFVEA